MMKRRIIVIGAAIVIAVSTLVIIRMASEKESDVTFDTVKVESGNIYNTVTATGTIEAITTVEVGTQVSGILQHIYADFNDNVKQGQILARLDETSLKAQLDQSQSQVDQAQAQLTFQEATYRRLKVLYDKELIAQSDYDQALFNYENSKASLSSARSALSRAKVNLDYATITSPIDGVVLNRAVEEGQTVAASFNTPTLFTIVNDLTQMEVQTSVDEADIGKVNRNQRVEFTVDAYPDMKFTGNVSEVRLQPVTTNNVVTYVVILSAPNPEKKLMPGMTASAIIYVEERENSLVLSGKALRFTPDGAYLAKMAKTMKADGSLPLSQTPPLTGSAGAEAKALPPAGFSSGQVSNDPKTKTVWIKDTRMGIHPNMIKIGIDNGSGVEVLSGLKEGDQVVIAMTEAGSVSKTETSGNTPRGPFPF